MYKELLNTIQSLKWENTDSDRKEVLEPLISFIQQKWMINRKST